MRTPANFSLKTAIIAKCPKFGFAMPWRHVAPARHIRDELAALTHIVIAQQRERRGLSRPVAHGALIEDDERNVLAERDGPLRRNCRSRQSEREDGHRDDYPTLHQEASDKHFNQLSRENTHCDMIPSTPAGGTAGQSRAWSTK